MKPIYLKVNRLVLTLSVLFCNIAFSPIIYCKPIPNYKVVLTDKPNRGMIAIHRGKGEVSVSWRMFKKDASDISFDIYRTTSGKVPVKINNEPLTNSTYYTDHGVDTSKDQLYSLYIHNKNKKAGKPIATYLLSVERAKKPYISIPLAPLKFESAALFQPNDASVGDLDGDGELEIVIKRMGAFYACSQAGMCPGGIILEAYKLNGTRLWQMDLGPNIRQGAQYFQFLVYDFDGDGRAEVAMKTCEGTRFGDNKVIGDTNGDGVTDYVNRDSTSRMYGKILTGPEYFSVVDGRTGKELARGPYIERGKVEDWGDNYGNRVDRQLGAVGYFDGKTPCIFWGRGYNGKSVMHTWTFRNGKLKRLWVFDTSTDKKYKDYEDQGNHNIRIGDVDGDGKDEVIYGACAIDHDGTPLHTTKLGHGDAMHLTDIDPSHPGLEVWQSHEYAPSPAGSSLRDAVTGELLVKIPSTSDVGRCMCADIDPRYAGCEIWSSQSGGLLSCKGELISKKVPSINMAVWWDGDLSRELLDGTRIEKWTGDGVITLFDGKKDGILSNNGSKANPCLAADILGDWREEVIWRSKDNNELRIYLTPYETSYRFPSFLEDIIYRLSVVTQNVGYNQPTQPGFYFGTDNDQTMKKAFDKLDNVSWKEKMSDNGTEDWTNQWFLDGKRAKITNTSSGMRFNAGSTPLSDADHVVLWTKKDFKGNIKVDYDFVRLDTVNRFVNIIYLQAEGSGKAPYSKDIAEWNNLREVPAMNTYFNHMNALHLSYAAFENDSPITNPDYIRARRYMPETGKGLAGTNLSPEYLCPQLFQTNIMHHITIIKNNKILMMRVTCNNKDRYFRFTTDGFPAIESGKIGLRQMCTRESLYSNFKVSEQ
ncbi:rhamnogalacturonan lyase [uncultured Bacteroides sp.]|uniref:rhamnogalacturonan lyase n=1 Tax=uncultured Bacteroides sp. TaxID=162156 RepID=UPI002AA71CFE|nr:rhamnogalacturonan lyase [uncultured Bacteroides sp.]